LTTFGMQAGVAIITVTAAENCMQPATGNAKRIKVVNDLELKIYKS